MPTENETRHLELRDVKSHKFWSIELNGKKHTVHFGRIGSTGQKKAKSFSTKGEARNSFDKLIAQKLKKGYLDVGSSATSTASTDPGAKHRPRTRYLKHPPVDLELAFTPGRRFSCDKFHYEMAVHPVGDLCLPSGKIVAADPGNLDDHVEDYFQRKVPPGTYPVDLAICNQVGKRRGGGSTACMRITFRDAPIKRWIIATTKGQKVNDLMPFQIYGYGVDVGMGSFADSSGLVAILEAYEEEGKELYEEFYFEQVLPAMGKDALSADIKLDESSGSNLIVCSSGYGDGLYASYWGMGDDGKPVSLVTDFGLLSRYVYESREIGPLKDLLDRQRQFELPGGRVNIKVKKLSARKISVLLRGEGRRNLEVLVVHKGEPMLVKGGGGTIGENEQTEEIQFYKAIPNGAVLKLKYLDHIDPL